MKDSFPVRLPLRIDWSETDIFGHINNLAIQKYAQAARVCLLEEAKLMNLLDTERKGPVIASTKCQFLKPVFYPGNVIAYSRVELLKNTSFGVFNVVINDNNEIVAQVNDIIVFFDFEKKTKTALPQNIRESLERLMNGEYTT
ncbi:MAG TPA: acyl-CoA thioesterase [Bacteroidales bacterium]|nr:acyl-CoA thioesterase [Bacteroidales bacterium]